MNLDFNVMVFLIGFVFALPIIGYLFRFSIPISLFFFIGGTFLISILLVTDGIILNDRIDNIVATESTFNITTSTISIPDYAYNVITSNSEQNIDSAGTNPRAIIEIFTPASSIIGQEVACMNVPLRDIGTTSINNVIVGTFDVSSNPVMTFGTINASSIGTSMRYIEFCLPDGQTHTISNNDRFGVNYFFDTNNNGISTLRDTTNPFDGTNSFSQRYFTSWSNSTTVDNSMQLYTYEEFPNDVQVAGIGGIYSYEDNVMDFSFTGDNYQLKVIMIFVAVMLMVGGALTEVRKR